MTGFFAIVLTGFFAIFLTGLLELCFVTVLGEGA